MPNQVTPELMRSQIEVGTKVCHSMQDVREQLGNLRQVIRMCRTVMGSRLLRLRLTHLRVGPIKSLPLGRGMRRSRASFKDWPTACHLRDACSRWCGRP